MQRHCAALEQQTKDVQVGSTKLTTQLDTQRTGLQDTLADQAIALPAAEQSHTAALSATQTSLHARLSAAQTLLDQQNSSLLAVQETELEGVASQVAAMHQDTLQQTQESMHAATSAQRALLLGQKKALLSTRDQHVSMQQSLEERHSATVTPLKTMSLPSQTRTTPGSPSMKSACAKLWKRNKRDKRGCCKKWSVD